MQVQINDHFSSVIYLIAEWLFLNVVYDALDIVN